VTATTLITKKTPTPNIKGCKRTDVTWNGDAIGVYFYLNPQIYEANTFKCISKVAEDLGLNENTNCHWDSLSSKSSEKAIQIWYPLVKTLTWKCVIVHFAMG
jgi:hypothetical protein